MGKLLGICNLLRIFVLKSSLMPVISIYGVKTKIFLSYSGYSG